MLYFGGWVVVAAPILGCRGDPVVSYYKEAPKQIAATISLPELQVGGSPSAGAQAIVLPRNQRFRIEGQLVGASRLKRPVDFAFLEINPRGKPKTVYANAFMKFESISNDIVEYSVVIEPVEKSGEVELRLRFNEEPEFTLSARLAD